MTAMSTERLDTLKKMCAAGETLQCIATELGVTRQRVHQLMNSGGSVRKLGLGAMRIKAAGARLQRTKDEAAAKECAALRLTS